VDRGIAGGSAAILSHFDDLVFQLHVFQPPQRALAKRLHVQAGGFGHFPVPSLSDAGTLLRIF